MNPSNSKSQTIRQENDIGGWITIGRSSNKRKSDGTICLKKQSLLQEKAASKLLDLPLDVLSRGVLPFLDTQELCALGTCSSQTKYLCNDGFLWKARFQQHFPLNSKVAILDGEWKDAYRIFQGRLQSQMRCFHNRKTCVEDIVGVGVNFTVNPKKRTVDYISLSQDLISRTAFEKDHIRADVFENRFKLFLPLYFTKQHFERALPRIQRTIVKLCPEKKTSKFFPSMILDVFPKIVTTFVVLLSDHGVSASQKSFDGLMRIHRLFLALAQKYPAIQKQATQRLQAFVRSEKNRLKSSCPSLGSILPLLMIVDEERFTWAEIRATYLVETFDRSILWACKEFPHLANLPNGGDRETTAEEEDRISLTREALSISLRLTMFHVFFNKVCCKGTVLDRALACDAFFMDPKTDVKVVKGGTTYDSDDDAGFQQIEISGPTLFDYVQEAAIQNSASTQSTTVDTEGLSPGASISEEQEEHRGHPKCLIKSTLKNSVASFDDFRDHVNYITTVNSWQRFFHFIGLRGPKTKSEMAFLLRMHVKNSLRKKYHKAGMDFSRVHASGTSIILSKGQKHTVSSALKRVVFSDVWNFEGNIVYLDATCLLYADFGRVATVDYCNRTGCDGAVQHSGDMIDGQQGTHNITIDLEKLPARVSSCVFVISAWGGAALADIISPSISFQDSDAEDGSAAPLCVYDLDAHDKVSHLTSVIMCKLYRVHGGNNWHVLAIGDSHRGSADNYEPIYKATEKLL